MRSSTIKEIQASALTFERVRIDTCWIAVVMAQCGLDVPPAWNRQGKERQNPCPLDVRPKIARTLAHLGLIPKRVADELARDVEEVLRRQQARSGGRR
jgi:hypothetical protein